MNYGERLNHSLERSKKSRRELAERINVSPQAIGMIITSAGGKERRLSSENHLQAANFLSVSPYWLSTGEGGIDEHKQEEEINISRVIREHERKRLEPLVQEARSQSDLWSAVRILRSIPTDHREKCLDFFIRSVNCESEKDSEEWLKGFSMILALAGSSKIKKDP